MAQRLLFVGFGNVGRAFAKMLLRKTELLVTSYGIHYVVCGVITGSHGYVVCGSDLGESGGLDLQMVLSALNSGVADTLTLTDVGAAAAARGADVSSSLSPPTDALQLVRESHADVLFEGIPVNYATGEPALSILRTGIGAGMHVISANKGPVVHGYGELRALAAKQTPPVRYLHESAVMDGVPIFSLQRACLRGAEVTGFEGVLNSTTNIILRAMERGEAFGDALVSAQAAGIAEADPSGDIDGFDSAVKVAALCRVLLGREVAVADVAREGIRGVTMEQVVSAAADGERFKLMCRGRLGADGSLKVAEVGPERVGPGSAFYQLDAADSAVTFYTDVLQPVTVTSHHPTNDDTAFGLLSDFITAMRGGS